MYTLKTNNLPSLKMTLSFLLIAGIILLSSCSDDDPAPSPTPPNNTVGLGWNGEDDASNIPNNIFLGNTDNLPSSYSLLERFPPVGNQGSFGTCVGWAAGYNLKTALTAIDQNWTTNNELQSTSVQGSAKDLFLSIPNNKKGANCNGTNFEIALDQLLERGVATMDVSPYVQLGDCSQSPDASATADAADNKISNYRRITKEVNGFKSYLADNRPILFGAYVGTTFTSYRSDQVFTQDGGNTGGHAMVIVGYDDNRGPNGAFEVLNSWGSEWGSLGTVWVDYNLMMSSWADNNMFFVATNGASSDFDPSDSENTDNNSNGDYDLIPWDVTDLADPNSPRDRQMTYNVYNIGTQTVSASQDWNVSYVYYNAFDANDFGILLYDEYSTTYGPSGENGPINSGGPGLSGNWWNNIDIPSLSGAAQILGGSEYFVWDYTMPDITGYYYLVCIADAYDAIAENDESNNYYFLTDEFGDPIYFENGEAFSFTPNDNNEVRSPQARSQALRQKQPAQHSDHRNAYTPQEIMSFIKHKKEAGELDIDKSEFTSKKSI